ncbi:MAG: hypothetical protein DME00_11800 [Candidatus Rokuibacteriota bacterium]|nr:MAG: hypothetical protein DME00_11800 [Candidatus Rokubacteria bacterium]
MSCVFAAWRDAASISRIARLRTSAKADSASALTRSITVANCSNTWVLIESNCCVTRPERMRIVSTAPEYDSLRCPSARCCACTIRTVLLSMARAASA